MRVEYVATNCVESPALCHRPASVERVERFLTVSLLWNAMFLIRKRWSRRGEGIREGRGREGKNGRGKIEVVYTACTQAPPFLLTTFVHIMVVY